MGQPKIEGVKEFLARVLFGSDQSDFYAIRVDSDGHIHVDVETSALPTGAATETTLGAIKTALQLLDDPRALGNWPLDCYDRWSEDLSGTKSGAGTYASSTPVVPAGYIYILQHFYFLNDSGARGRAYLEAYDGSNWYTLERNLTPAHREVVTWTGTLVLKEGDSLRVRQFTCLDGDSIQAGVWGYKMKIA